MPDTTLWFTRSQAAKITGARLFCFPYAGGGPAVFGRWQTGLPDDLELWAAHFPGRGSRFREPPYNRLTSLVEILYQAIQPLLDRPFAFFGHSLGALVAFELARHLHRCKLPQPTTLFVSACSAPHIRDPRPPIHDLPEGEFLETLRRLKGTPPEVLGQPETMALILPALRADFEVLETYLYAPGNSLSCPIIAFGGLKDPWIGPERLQCWAMHTSSTFKLQFFPGDHFFLNTAREALLASIALEVRRESQ